MSTTSIQVRLDLTAIRGSVASFGTGDRSEYCAVMEVFGSQQSLAKLDDAKQEAVLAGYAQFLNSLTFPSSSWYASSQWTSRGMWLGLKNGHVRCPPSWSRLPAITRASCRAWCGSARCWNGVFSLSCRGLEQTISATP